MNKAELQACARLLHAVVKDLGGSGSAFVGEAAEMSHEVRQALQFHADTRVQVEDLAGLVEDIANKLEA